MPGPSPEGVSDFAAMTHANWATLRSVDDSVERLCQALQEQGDLDTTIIV